MATYKLLNIDKGSSFFSNLAYLDDNKVPIDITGYSLRAQLRRSYTSANSIAFVSNIDSSVTGNVTLFLDSYTTANLVAGRYLYDVEIYKSNTYEYYNANANANITVTTDTLVTRIFEGMVVVNPGVTR